MLFNIGSFLICFIVLSLLNFFLFILVSSFDIMFIFLLSIVLCLNNIFLKFFFGNLYRYNWLLLLSNKQAGKLISKKLSLICFKKYCSIIPLWKYKKYSDISLVEEISLINSMAIIVIYFNIIIVVYFVCKKIIYNN